MFNKLYRVAVCVLTTPIAIISGAAMMHRLAHGGHNFLEEEDFI